MRLPIINVLPKQIAYESIKIDNVPFGYSEILSSIPDDNYTDKSVPVAGIKMADKLSYLMRNNRGRFKVYIQVVVDDRVIFESNKKYITIYKEGDCWRHN